MDPGGEQVTYEFLGGRHFHPADSRRVTFERLAVTPTQIEEWGLPTRPTKKSDARAKNFRGESVEVDAIRAPQLRALLNGAITSHIDPKRHEQHQLVEDAERESALQFLDSWRASGLGS